MMKLTVKTLKGSKFVVDCEPTNTVLEVKGIIVSDERACVRELRYLGKVNTICNRPLFLLYMLIYDVALLCMVHNVFNSHVIISKPMSFLKY
jgi:hypothetical protein